VGSVDYIKKKFGAGYNLIIQSRFFHEKEPRISFFRSTREKLESQTFEIMSKIHSITPEAYQFDDSGANLLKCVLPFTEQHKFAELFSELEKLPDIQVD